jgi:hypothetical protein
MDWKMGRVAVCVVEKRAERLDPRIERLLQLMLEAQGTLGLCATRS